jgi:hypothetical protein
MSAQSSLTAPKFKKPNLIDTTTHPQLSDAETKQVMDVGYINIKNLCHERKYTDPRIPGQTYSLHSWVPSPGATPDEDGIYGMIKIRGTFSSMEEANEKAEDLIRNHDSYHKIYHGWVGKPLPLTVKSDFSGTVEEIDIQQKVSKIVRADIKDKRQQEKQQVKHIRERERNLKEAVEQEAADPYEKYTCLRVKKAQVIWGYMEHRKKLGEMTDVFEKTLAEVKEMDEEDSDYAARYYDRYMEARRSAGIPDDKNDQSFMKYLNTDVVNLETYSKDQDALAIKNDPNYRVSRLAGNTVTVERRPQPHDHPEVDEKKLEAVPEVAEIEENEKSDVIKDLETTPKED